MKKLQLTSILLAIFVASCSPAPVSTDDEATKIRVQLSQFHAELRYKGRSLKFPKDQAARLSLYDLTQKPPYFSPLIDISENGNAFVNHPDFTDGTYHLVLTRKSQNGKGDFIELGRLKIEADKTEYQIELGGDFVPLPSNL